MEPCGWYKRYPGFPSRGFRIGNLTKNLNLYGHIDKMQNRALKSPFMVRFDGPLLVRGGGFPCDTREGKKKGRLLREIAAMFPQGIENGAATKAAPERREAGGNGW